jgi:hypothetical protein
VMTCRQPGQDPSQAPNSISAFALYTFKNQVRVMVIPQMYPGAGAWKASVALGYWDFPDEFYGLGNDTPDDEEEFTTAGVMLRPALLRRMWRDLRVGLFCEIKGEDVTEIEADGALATGDVFGVGGGLLSGVGPVLEWDSRDNTFFPRSGGLHKFHIGLYRDALGSEYEFEAYSLDMRQYVSVAESHVLAFHLHGEVRSGEIPFYELPTLRNLRGIRAGRFRDDAAVSGQVEYRFPVGRRWFGAVFAGAGDVIGDKGEDGGGIKYSGGAGIRYVLNEKEGITVRLDIGVSPWGVDPYIRILEAF